MKCGEFDKRNQQFLNCFNEENYFKSLISSDINGDVIIFDVGAHKGESAIFFNKLFPDSKIYSFEPNPLAAENISTLNLKNVQVFNMALTDRDGMAEFYIQDISHLSSLNMINKSSEASVGYAEKEKHTVQDVTVMRGDEFCVQNKVDYINFLKIDVQANEVSTLKGFSNIISKVDCVFVEVSLYDFYSNKSSIGGIETLLPNFELFDIYEISKNPKTMGTDWATLVYKRTV